MDSNTELNPAQTTFLSTYTSKLREDRVKHPERYVWPVEDIERVALKMVRALTTGEANKDSHAIRQTCTALGIRYTYLGIHNYLNQVA